MSVSKHVLSHRNSQHDTDSFIRAGSEPKPSETKAVNVVTVANHNTGERQITCTKRLVPSSQAPKRGGGGEAKKTNSARAK